MHAGDEDSIASLDDLDAALSSYDGSEDSMLKKLSAFTRSALYLHHSTKTLEERRKVDEKLQRIVIKHGLPEDCVESSIGR
jgi:hypothetical protein